MPEGKCYDAIVIGAGLSGLSAAKLLHESGQDVLVLEARDRVGGRTYTIHNKDVRYVDLGGAYIGPTQNRLLRIAEEFGLKTHLTHCKDDNVHSDKRGQLRYQGLFPRGNHSTEQKEAQNVLDEMERLATQIPIEAPQNAKNAELWDRMNVQEWMDQTFCTEVAKAIVTGTVMMNMCVEPYEISLLFFLWYIKGAGGPIRINDVPGGAQERKFLGGAQQISIKMAEILGIGDRVLLRRPVMRIHWQESPISVWDQNGSTYHTKRVIMAVPLPIQNKITYEPQLPSLRTQMITKAHMGSVIKTFVYYKTPFWRDLGYSGTTLIMDEGEPLGASMDDTKPDGTHAALMGFILANKASAMARLTKEERRDRLALNYSKIFNSPEALNPIHYEEMDWPAEQWSGGCYTVMCPPGFFTRFGGVLRKPVGHMYFAGTETATVWPGYMEGALQAGERAAREIQRVQKSTREESSFSYAPPISSFARVGIDRSLHSLYLNGQENIQVLHSHGLINESDIWQDEPEREMPPPLSKL